MGTKVVCKSYLPAYYSMRDLNEDSSSSSWPQFYGDNGITNGQHYNGFVPRNMIDGYPGYEKDTLKQKMLEHETVFKNQVYELHRLYRIQRDMMEDVKKTRASVDPSSSSSLQGSQVPSEDPRKWHMAGIPLINSSHTRPTNSPLSFTKGINNTQTGRSLFQNGYKDYEALDSRPLKVRKKLFDLQLPADEYIDTEDGEKVNGVCDAVMDCRIDASASRLRNGISLADLNEPIQIDETMAASSVDFFGQTFVSGETKGINQSAKSNTHDKFLINLSVESRVDDKERLFNLYETGSSKSNHISQGHRQDKLPAPSYPGQGMLFPLHHPSGTYPTGYNREASWRNGTHYGLEYSNRNLDRSKNTHLEPVEVSQGPSSFLFINSSFASSRTHSLSSCKPNGFVQKINSFDSAMDICLPFGGKSMVNSSSRLNPGSASEMTIMPNRFQNGPASGSKELHFHLPSGGFDDHKSCRVDNVASDRETNRGFGKFPVSSSVEPKPPLDFNLNEVLSNTAEGHQLPLWLPKPVYGNEVTDRPNCKNEAVRDLNQQFTPKETQSSNDCEIITRNEIGAETPNVRKILGFPIFELKNEPSSLVSTSKSVECPRDREAKCVSNERRSKIIDINLEYEPDEQIAAEELIVRDQIDLNARLNDSEDPSAHLYESKRPGVKIPFEIDLEAPVLLESEDDNVPLEENTPNEASLQSVENENEQIQDGVLRNAAETMVFISSSCPEILIEDESEAPTMEAFLSFVKAINSCTNELEGNDSPKRDVFNEVDEFEAMTLQLVETKEKDYMPVPFVPEIPKNEDSGTNAVLTRPRRGQSRRGRQRKDFQRDILPGLMSLSRYEVTEDIQIFGGMMKATGHSWNSGLTRRNGTRGGAGRGRRRVPVETAATAGSGPVSASLVQQISNIEACLEDRSLTGWGKTIRRPRRQRCRAGNPPPAFVLT